MRKINSLINPLQLDPSLPRLDKSPIEVPLISDSVTAALQKAIVRAQL